MAQPPAAKKNPRRRQEAQPLVVDPAQVRTSEEVLFQWEQKSPEDAKTLEEFYSEEEQPLEDDGVPEQALTNDVYSLLYTGVLCCLVLSCLGGSSLELQMSTLLTIVFFSYPISFTFP